MCFVYAHEMKYLVKTGYYYYCYYYFYENNQYSFISCGFSFAAQIMQSKNPPHDAVRTKPTQNPQAHKTRSGKSTVISQFVQRSNKIKARWNSFWVKEIDE